jgi:pilus assembly protein Flp/PilA
MWNMLNSAWCRFTARAQLSREEGQGLVEYALILALVSIAVVTALELVGTDVGNLFTSVTSAL